MFQAQYPRVVHKIKLTISHEQKTKAKPIIDTHNIFLPVPAKFGFPAEIIIIIPPIVSIKIAKGVATQYTTKLKILLSRAKKSLIVQGLVVPGSVVGPGAFPQGTNIIWAFTKTGAKTKSRINKLISKKSFFIMF